MRGRDEQLLTSQCEGLSQLSKWDTRAGKVKRIAPTTGRANGAGRGACSCWRQTPTLCVTPRMSQDGPVVRLWR